MSDIISTIPDDAVKQILEIAQEKGVMIKLKKNKQCEYYEFGSGTLIYENSTTIPGRQRKGLLTTNDKSIPGTPKDNKYKYKLNTYLKWIEKYGKSPYRNQYDTLGKTVLEIKRIFDILIQVDNQNKYHMNKERRKIRRKKRLEALITN